MFGQIWNVVRDGDPRVSDIYSRHYSCYRYADGRRKNINNRSRHLVMGPGYKTILLTTDCKAIFGWRKFIDDSGQTGVNCAFFRNEGAYNGMLSSEMILAAEGIARIRWGDERLYTYVNTSRVNGDGYCFKCAGWRKCGRTKLGLLILEKIS